MKNKSILYFALAATIALSCNHNIADEPQADTADNLISLSSKQLDAGNIALGDPAEMQFDEYVRCTGTIRSYPSGTALITTPVPGFVSRIDCSAGQEIRKGQVLFELSGNDFTDLQQGLAETAAQLKKISSEYERIKSLYSEKVGSEKEMIMAGSEYKTAMARYAALRMKVNMLGLDAARISDGYFYSSFPLKSPIDGYVSQVNVSLGEFADQHNTLAEVLNLTKLQLRLDVFGKDLGRLREKQKVIFTTLESGGESYTATLRSTGRDVDEESKTVACWADIDKPGGRGFVNNAYAEAMIITGSDTVTAVPEEAVIRSEGNDFLLELVKSENDTTFLKKTRVNIGRIYKGYAEILNNPVKNKIITKGAFNITIE